MKLVSSEEESEKKGTGGERQPLPPVLSTSCSTGACELYRVNLK